MTTATAEKPTCKYSLQAQYVYTQCGQMEWADETRKDKFYRHCGGKIERVAS